MRSSLITEHAQKLVYAGMFVAATVALQDGYAAHKNKREAEAQATLAKIVGHRNMDDNGVHQRFAQQIVSVVLPQITEDHLKQYKHSHTLLHAQTAEISHAIPVSLTRIYEQVGNYFRVDDGVRVTTYTCAGMYQLSIAADAWVPDNKTHLTHIAARCNKVSPSTATSGTAHITSIPHALRDQIAIQLPHDALNSKGDITLNSDDQEITIRRANKPTSAAVSKTNLLINSGRFTCELALDAQSVSTGFWNTYRDNTDRNPRQSVIKIYTCDARPS